MATGVVDKEKGTPVTQARGLVPVERQATPVVTQAGLLAASRRPPAESVRVSQSTWLTGIRRPPVETVRIPQAAELVATNYEGNIGVVVTQAAVLMAWKTGVPGQTRQRAWTFDFDGHSFYVLDLAQEGTWVMDMTTGQWSKFETPGFGVWNLLNGFGWESNRMVVGGDSIESTVLRLDPTSPYDDGWRPVTYKVTGGFSTRARNSVSVDSVRLAVSNGYMADTAPTINLRFSDDNGATWSDDYPFLLEKNNYTQRIEWNSLGRMAIPGRVFEFSDEGGLIRIDGADVQIEGQ